MKDIDENDDRIIGGAATTIRAHPYQISLRFRNTHICGGSILNTNRILTAAHCLLPRSLQTEYSVMAGSTLRLGDANAQIQNVTRFIAHAQYDARTTRNDIAVLHLIRPLRFGATVRAINLPQLNVALPDGRLANVTGWGHTRFGVPNSRSNALQVVAVPINTQQACIAAYGSRITRDMFCAGFPQGGRDSCQEDSGGPLVINNVQFGIISWGRGCGFPRFPGVYARVPHFHNWIRQNI